MLFAFPTIDREMVEYLKGLIESGQFTPVIDRTYDLSDVVEAYRYVETQQKTGNVVITIAAQGDG
jgi:NADPH:quinone reductase-like Zn-dependent oxidoreductase